MIKTRTVIVASMFAMLLTACDKPSDTPAAGATGTPGTAATTTPDRPAGLEGVGGHVKK
jgi:hypothetical protein